MKKGDIVIIVLLLILSFLPYSMVSRMLDYDYNTTYARSTVGGVVYQEIPLTGHKGREEYVITTDYGTNVVVVEDETIAILSADCPDKVCMEPGAIHKPGRSLICLPNKFLVEVHGKIDENELDAIPY